MVRETGAMLNTTVKIRQQINDLCKSRPLTYADIANELGFTYKTAWTHVQALIKDGKVVESGRRDGAATFSAIQQRNIPHIPGPTESVSPMRMILKIAETKGKYRGRLEVLTERWNAVISGILRTAVVIEQEDKFPKERHEDLERYLRMYREELNMRLSQVNALLQTEKFWTLEGLKDFPNDPGYNAKAILDAYQSANAILNADKVTE